MSKKTSVPAPDYSAVAQASKEAAELMAKLGYDQMDEARRQYDTMLPMVERVTNSQLELGERAAANADWQLAMQQDATDRQLAIMEETADQGRDYFDYMKNTFRPLEEQMVQDAKDYNTDAEFERQAGQAAADVASRSGIERDANERQMAAMGVNPNSGRFQAGNQQSALLSAGMGAGAMNQARQNASNIGYARMMDATGLGRGLAGASQGAYALASQGGANVAGTTAGAGSNMMGHSMNAGNSALGNMNQHGANYMAGLGQGAGTISAGIGHQMGGLGNVLSSQTSVHNTAQQQQGAGMAGLGSFLGGAAALAI